MHVIDQLPVPRTLAGALDPAWLGQVLAPLAGGAAVTGVETVEVIRTVATKARVKVLLAGREPLHLCLKGLLDAPPAYARGGTVTVLEAEFYNQLAPRMAVRVPHCVATVIDRADPMAIVIMRDVIADGGRFRSAREDFTPDEAAASLEQIARLHASGLDVRELPWVTRRVKALAESQYLTEEQLQDMLDGPRGEGLPAQVRNARNLRAAMRELAARDLETPDFLVHGDAHAGNIFETAEGLGLIDWQLLQCGGWALDLAYHINAVLPVAVAEANERALLAHYLGLMRGAGVEMPGEEVAFRLYREAATYGYFLWAITRSVDPEITNIFNGRLGAAVTRHGSFGLLGIG